MKRLLRVLVADDEPEIRDYLSEALPRLGHEVVGTASSGRELIDKARATNPDLVIADIRMPDIDGIEAAMVLNRDRQVPVIIVSAHHDAETLTRLGADHIMGYLIKPVSEAELKAAITLALVRYRHFLALSREAADLRQALEDRKLVEKAKGAVMKRLRVDEDEAFRRLRKHASDQNLKLAEISRRVLAAEETFRLLEGS
jgi:response regulator NasT